MDRRSYGLLLGVALLTVLFVWWRWPEQPAEGKPERSTIEAIDRATAQDPTQPEERKRERRRSRQARVAPLSVVETLPSGTLGVYGQVFLQATGQPVGNATVILSDYLGKQSAVLSGAEGRFAIDSGKLGRVTVQAIMRENNGIRLESDVLRTAITAEDAPVGPLNLYIGAPASAVVEVLDGQLETPVVAAKVKRLMPQHADVEYTDARGRLVLHGQPGVTRFEIEADGYAKLLANIELTPENPLVRLMLTKEATVDGVVLRADGSPVAAAKVVLSSMVSPQQSVMTDDAGNFSFRNIVSFKPHMLKASKVLENNKLVESSSATFVTRPGDDLRYLTLETNMHTVSDQHLVTCLVVSEEEVPIENAALTVYGMQLDSGEYHEIGRYWSDQDGYISLPPIEQTTDDWRQPVLVFRHEGYAPTVDILGWVAENTPEKVIVMRQGKEWQGRVVDADGKGVRNVSIYGEFGFTEHQLPLLDPEVALSQADGNFYLKNLPRIGRLFFMADGYAPFSLEIAGYKELPAEVVLEAPRHISGVVVNAVDGQPLNSYSLAVQPANVLTRGFQTSTSAALDPMSGVRYFANPQGRFELEDMPLQQDLSLWFEAAGYASQEVVVSRRDRGDVELTIEMKEDGLTIAGVVLDEFGNPFPHATVWLTESKSAIAWLNMPRSRLWGMMTRTGDEMASSDSNGQFRFERLSATRDWALVAWADDTAIASQYELMSLTDKARQNIVLQFPPSGGLKFVVNPNRGFDIKNISYSPVDAPLATKSKSLDSGEFVWEVTGLAEETYNVKFRAVMDLMTITGSRSYESDVDVAVIAGEVVEVPLGFERTYNLGGRALWNGAPLGNASIFLLDEDGAIRTKVFTSATGDFLFEEIKEGFYTVFAPSNAQMDRNMLGWPLEGHPNRISVELRGADLNETFEFAAFPNVVGQIAQSENISRVYLAKTMPNGKDEYVQIRRLDQQGTFLFHGVPDGVYQLRAWRAGSDGLIILQSGIQIPATSEVIQLGVVPVPQN